MSADSPHADVLLPAFLSSSTSVLLSKADDLFSDILETAVEPFGLRAKDFIVLAAIDSMGPQSQQQLARIHGIDRTTMVSVVDGLERLGLVQRARNPDDRRKYAIGLTGEGQALLHDELAPVMLNALDGFLAPLDADERARLNTLLWRLVHDRDRPAQP
ncbi:MarR family transcriptional regulator [Sphaerisporangium krabiense]|uniref:DNA-binding MarR family transcriptional regulator n=1 Tax=Sphaerisporangium krabiense TaxID=763782 RepID=A0A7W8ZA19_9ACTN|nr:MarR family transcriptional regulator [Sphaerisporangium krabiense]MBB5630254.1 DNA-binding MarR family transcriptional regulator [Sphaerisporangium krabiense]GII62794.1 MarR family transcriptional regulator [Sphaerisporangium krabiense]